MYDLIEQYSRSTIMVLHSGMVYVCALNKLGNLTPVVHPQWARTYDAVVENSDLWFDLFSENSTYPIIKAEEVNGQLYLHTGLLLQGSLL